MVTIEGQIRTGAVHRRGGNFGRRHPCCQGIRGVYTHTRNAAFVWVRGGMGGRGSSGWLGASASATLSDPQTLRRQSDRRGAQCCAGRKGEGMDSVFASPKHSRANRLSTAHLIGGETTRRRHVSMCPRAQCTRTWSCFCGLTCGVQLARKTDTKQSGRKERGQTGFGGVVTGEG